MAFPPGRTDRETQEGDHESKASRGQDQGVEEGTGTKGGGEERRAGKGARGTQEIGQDEGLFPVFRLP